MFNKMDDEPESAWIHMVMDRLHEVEAKNNKLAAVSVALKDDNDKLRGEVELLQHNMKADQHVALGFGNRYRIIVDEENKLAFQGKNNVGEWHTLLSVRGTL